MAERYRRVNFRNLLFESEEFEPELWFEGYDLANLSETDEEDYSRILQSAYEREAAGETLTPAQKWVLNAEREIERTTVLGSVPLKSTIVGDGGELTIRVLGDD
jgi:hypothetical protein